MIRPRSLRGQESQVSAGNIHEARGLGDSSKTIPERDPVIHNRICRKPTASSFGYGRLTIDRYIQGREKLQRGQMPHTERLPRVPPWCQNRFRVAFTATSASRHPWAGRWSNEIIVSGAQTLLYISCTNLPVEGMPSRVTANSM